MYSTAAWFFKEIIYLSWSSSILSHIFAVIRDAQKALYRSSLVIMDATDTIRCFVAQ